MRFEEWKCVCVFACVHVRVCVHACMRACVPACVPACGGVGGTLCLALLHIAVRASRQSVPFGETAGPSGW